MSLCRFRQFFGASVVVALANALTCDAAAAIQRAPEGRAAREQPRAKSALAFTGVTVIDVASGRLASNQTVVVLGNRVHAIGRAGKIRIPRDAQVIDARGKYLIPGLWDMHVHTGAIDNGYRGPGALDEQTRQARASGDADILYPYFIATGITGVRELGTSTPIETLLGWRHEIAAGARIGPRLLVAGRYISSNIDTPMSYGPTTTAGAQAAVDSIKASGADHVKVHVTSSRDVFFAVAAAARRAGLPLVGHVDHATIVESVDSGQRSFEHVTSQVCDPTAGGGVDTASVAMCSDIAARMRRHNSWVMPGAGGYMTQPICARRDTVTAVELAALGTYDSPRCLNRPVTPAKGWTVLPILAGTDATLGLWQEARLMPEFKQSVLEQHPIQDQLARLVAGGLSPLAALQTATLNPAIYLNGTDSLGTVAPGRLADLLLLDENPLEDIWNTTKIRAVVANGRYYDRAALDAIMAKLERDAVERTANTNKGE